VSADVKLCEQVVSKLCDDKLCVDVKLCEDKLCVDKLCVSEREATGGGGGRDAEPKTRTPHKDVGKNCVSRERHFFKFSVEREVRVETKGKK